MNYRCIAAHELEPSLVDRWAAIQASDPSLASPFFRPEFALVVAAVRRDLRVCVLEEGNRVVGFFPFHRGPLGIARPAGLGLSDHHAVVVEPGADWTAEALMRACGIVRWEFDHLLAAQPQWRHFVTHVEPSPVIDTSGSFESYLAEKRKPLETALRRQRKLEREVDGLRFEHQSLDPVLLQEVIRLKREQCRRTDAMDFFGLRWTVELLQRIHAAESSEFAGVLSALWAGDRLLAAHFGMRSGVVMHYWFPVYNHDFGQYSPGLVLLLELVREACREKLRYIDLGKDLSQYKTKFMTGEVAVASGCAVRPSLLNNGYQLWGALLKLRNAPIIGPPLRATGHPLRRMLRRRRYL